jgi:hypothetical protein
LSGPRNGMHRSGMPGIAPIQSTGKISIAPILTGVTTGLATITMKSFITTTIMARGEVGRGVTIETLITRW